MTKKSYRDLKVELDEVLERLQDPATDIDEALKLHATGKRLIAELESYLEGADKQVKKASKNI